MPRTVDLIFTRDFSLTINDIWYYLLSVRIAEEYGCGLPFQIIHFTGRSAECYRIREELEQVKHCILKKEINDPLFSSEKTNKFHKDIDAMHTIIQKKQPLQERQKDYAGLKELFTSMYPQYMLGVFLPYRWKDEFLKRHENNNTLAEEILEKIYQNRVYSEGMFNHVDKFCRQIMQDLGISIQYLPVVRVSEFENLLNNGQIPDFNILEKRKKEYILYHDQIFTDVSLSDFLHKHALVYDDIPIKKDLEVFKGVIASKGDIISGEVQIILNSQEVKQFKKGNILVTMMTSPDYVPAMKIAGAIVTDEGGITCHAAIVSRELGIPCVIGTKIATRVLKDGDMVEVDAGRGIVRKLTAKDEIHR